MFGRPLTLFSILGFPIRVHATWLVLAALLVTALAADLRRDPGFAAPAAWLVAGVVVVGVFASLIAHELTHSLVARRNGMRVHGITLFLLGGVAEMEDEPRTPWNEFAMAIVGPLMSLLLAAGFGVAWWVGRGASWPLEAVHALSLLARINLTLAIFNMIPAYPLDGGRVLRAVLWGLRGNLGWATRIAAALGVGFGGVLVVGGLVLVVVTTSLAPLLTVAVGAFLIGAARMGRRHAVVRGALRGETVRRFLQQDGAGSVPRWIPVSELVTDHLLARQERLVAVTDADRLIGCVTAEDVARVPREAWMSTSVGEIARPCSPDNAIALDAPAEEALHRMARTRLPRLVVVEDGRLVGFVTARDLMAFLSLEGGARG